jgi:DNA replication licensing factor MCM7
MVDDTDDPAPGSQRTRPSKLKYMNVLQDVANRTKSDILIDLNDLEAVCRA